MTKNRLLNIAIGICKIVKTFYFISAILLTLIFVHFQIDKEFYSNKVDTFSLNFKSGGVKVFERTLKWSDSTSEMLDDKKNYAISKINTTSLYILYFQYIGIIFLLFLSTNEFQKVMQSVKNIQTFRKQNVKSFINIGKYLIGFLILTSFTIINFENGGISRIGISLTPIYLILFAFIMAEIFKEGNALEVENELTI